MERRTGRRVTRLRALVVVAALVGSVLGGVGSAAADDASAAGRGISWTSVTDDVVNWAPAQGISWTRGFSWTAAQGISWTRGISWTATPGFSWTRGISWTAAPDVSGTQGFSWTAAQGISWTRGFSWT